MGNIVFLFPNVTGHLNRVIKIGKSYQVEGHSVYFVGNMDLLPFTINHSFKHYAINSVPFGIGLEDYIHNQQKYLESLMDRFSGRLLKLRRTDIHKMLIDLNPIMIFIDEFNVSDFKHLHNKTIETCKIIQIQTKFPMQYNKDVPPLVDFAFPGKKSRLLWMLFFIKRKLRHSWDFIRYFGKNDIAILKKESKKLMIEDKYPLNIKKVFHPTYDNLEEWFLVPKELDFPQQKLFPWQKYIGTTVDFQRNEELSDRLKNFILNSSSNCKLIYVSLGTIDLHINKKENIVKQFFKNLIEIFEENPHWHAIISMKVEFQAEYKTKAKNIIIGNNCPQISILSKADLFLTHSGTGSILEASHFKVPMLLFPLNNKWDQNGSAARMVYHGLGKKSDLNANKSELKAQIESFF